MSTAPDTPVLSTPDSFARSGPGGARSRRYAAATALVAAPVLAVVSELLQPDLSGSATQRLAAMADGPLPVVSAVAFLVGQLPMLVAVLAIGHLLRTRAPRLSGWGTGLGVLGAFGHTVFGGTSLVYLAMARDGSAPRATYAHLLDSIENSPIMLFSVVGLVGTVLGVLLLSIGLFRAGVGPRWVGPALWAFLVVEFVGTSLSRFAGYLSGLLFLLALVALAGQVLRQSDAAWSTAPDTAA